MSAPSLEAFLARIYIDAEARLRFRAHPRDEALKAGLTPEECRLLETFDWVGLELAAESFARRRGSKKVSDSGQGMWRRLRNLWRSLTAG